MLECLVSISGTVWEEVGGVTLEDLGPQSLFPSPLLVDQT